MRETRGDGVTVSDREIVSAMRHLAVHHGVSASPEAAAPFAALPKLLEMRAVHPDERVLLYLTGTGLVHSIDELERSIAP